MAARLIYQVKYFQVTVEERGFREFQSHTSASSLYIYIYTSVLGFLGASFFFWEKEEHF